MGSILYDYLHETVLFNEARLADGFSGLSDAELTQELLRYRSFCLAHLDALKREIPAARGNTILFSGSRPVGVDQLRRTALYVHAHVLDDPLFRLTRDQTGFARTAAEHLGYATSTFDRGGLCSALRFLRDVTPMVEADYVKFLPVSRIYEPPTLLPLTYSKEHFSDALPQHVLEFFHEQQHVRSMVQREQGWQILDDVRPSRGLFVRFKDDAQDVGYVYHLQDTETRVIDEAKRLVQCAFTMSHEPPPREAFDVWLLQTKNQAALAVHNALLTEYVMSTQCGALYLTRSQFAFDTLALLGKEPSGVAADTATSLLELELPVLEGVSSADLMRVRDDEEAFSSFRNALELGVAELRLEKEPEALRRKTENLVHQLTEINVRDVDQRLARLQKSAFAEAAILAAGLAGAISLTGPSLLATALAVFQGYKTYQDYRREVASNPAFFLWKLRRSRNKRQQWAEREPRARETE
jgi:hypothetical protein